MTGFLFYNNITFIIINSPHSEVCRVFRKIHQPTSSPVDLVKDSSRSGPKNGKESSDSGR